MPGPKHRSQILIVDDEPTQRLLVCRALRLDGHECFEAESVEAARRVLSGQLTFDLAISDINMPGESGMDLVRWISQSRPSTAVLMATAVDDRSVANEAIGMGIHGYLIKPFELNELRIAVANALRRQHLERLQEARSHELEQLVAERTDELQKATLSLSDRENRLASLVSSAPVGVLYSSLSGSCEYVNDVAAKMSGHHPDDLLGDGFLRVLHSDDLERVLHHLEGARKGHGPTSLEHRVIRPDGQVVTAHTRVAPVLDDEGDATAFVAIVEDVTEQRRFEQELAHQATHDDLTGLPNRHLLLDRIEQMLVGGSATVMLIDLDRFKFVNDVHGHTVGDRLLVAVAGALVAELAPSDTVARFGGDEFVVVTCARSDAEIAETVERVLSTLSSLTLDNEQSRSVTASIGVASAEPSSTPEDLLRGADMAMYRAKERGGSCYEVFDEDLGRIIQQRVRLENELRAAITRNELEVYYQPQVDCTSGHLWGVEALIRWRHPARGLLPASAFLPVVSEAGLMEPITNFVLTSSLSQSLAWTRDTPDSRPIRVAINISAHELETGALQTRVADALARSGLDPTHLTLEVTEESLINDLGRSALRLEALRCLGVRTSLDDFGTGYSSLSYLSRLPLDELKIDRIFVQRLGQTHQTPDTPPPDRQLVQAIIQLASIFKLRVIAEGIEHLNELETLREMGCSGAQGFLIGRPMHASDPKLLNFIRGNAFKHGPAPDNDQTRTTAPRIDSDRARS